MLAYAFVLFVVGGISYAAYLDLRTSEVPDWVSLTVAGGSLLYYGYQSIVAGSFDPLLASLASGTALFLLGWGMYLAGMWGGADAFVLGAAGYALPQIPAVFNPAYVPPWPAPLSLVLTVFLVGAIYSVLYAVHVALQAEGFQDALRAEFDVRRGQYSTAVVLYAALAVLGTAAVYAAGNPPLMIVARNFGGSLLLLILLLAVAHFLRTVESRVMQREIPVDELEAGDVLAEDIDLAAAREDAAEDVSDGIVDALRSLSPVGIPDMLGSRSERIAGVTPEQVEELQDRREQVAIRTGVRFIPSFPAAILILLFAGDPLYFILLQLL